MLGIELPNWLAGSPAVQAAQRDHAEAVFAERRAAAVRLAEAESDLAARSVALREAVAAADAAIARLRSEAALALANSREMQRARLAEMLRIRAEVSEQRRILSESASPAIDQCLAELEALRADTRAAITTHEHTEPSISGRPIVTSKTTNRRSGEARLAAISAAIEAVDSLKYVACEDVPARLEAILATIPEMDFETVKVQPYEAAA